MSIQNLKKTLSNVAGIEVDITIRGDKKFTFSTEEVSDLAAEKIKRFFAGYGRIEIEHDSECGSFIYLYVA